MGKKLKPGSLENTIVALHMYNPVEFPDRETILDYLYINHHSVFYWRDGKLAPEPHSLDEARWNAMCRQASRSEILKFSGNLIDCHEIRGGSNIWLVGRRTRPEWLSGAMQASKLVKAQGDSRNRLRIDEIEDDWEHRHISIRNATLDHLIPDDTKKTLDSVLTALLIIMFMVTITALFGLMLFAIMNLVLLPSGVVSQAITAH